MKKKFVDYMESSSGLELIYISGDGDYAVVAWEEMSEKESKKWIEQAKKKPGKPIQVESQNDEVDSIEITYYKFGPVDKKFIDFLRQEDISFDYDDSKHKAIEFLS
jgi:hypothetical protein